MRTLLFLPVILAAQAVVMLALVWLMTPTSLVREAPQAHAILAESTGKTPRVYRNALGSRWDRAADRPDTPDRFDLNHGDDARTPEKVGLEPLFVRDDRLAGDMGGYLTCDLRS